jgi:hypothetical protein
MQPLGGKRINQKSTRISGKIEDFCGVLVDPWPSFVAHGQS